MTPPAEASVPQHRWRDIEPSADASEMSVSVVLDGDGPADSTLTALRAQTHPESSIDIAGGGEGDVVVFLAAGTRPSSGFVSAHARWHAAAAGLVTLGPVGTGDSDPLGLVTDLTRDFTDLPDGVHLAAGVGSIGVRRELLSEAGGAGETSTIPGRLDLMLRLHCAGALFVPVPDAGAVGEAPPVARALATACERGRTLEAEYPRVASLVPLAPWRGVASPRRHKRPALVVNVSAEGAPAEQSVATIRGALDGRLGDLELRVQIPSSDPAFAAVSAAVADDERASVAPSSLDEACQVPFQARVSAVAKLDPRTLADLHELAVAEDAGAIHVTVPGASPQEAMIQVFATGAWRRARRMTADGNSRERIVGELYGERWVSGVEVSTRAHWVDEPQVTEHGPLAAATDIDRERNAHLRFRQRADDLAERAAGLAQRTLSERLRARRERQAAERAEAKLDT